MTTSTLLSLLNTLTSTSTQETFLQDLLKHSVAFTSKLSREKKRDTHISKELYVEPLVYLTL